MQSKQTKWKKTRRRRMMRRNSKADYYYWWNDKRKTGRERRKGKEKKNSGGKREAKLRADIKKKKVNSKSEAEGIEKEWKIVFFSALLY